MERKNTPPEQPRRDNEGQGGVPYQQLAADMAQPLADLHVPGANNEAGTTDDRRTAENENESCQVPHEPPRGESNAKQKRTPYQQLAADMAQPLADLHVPGANNEAGTTDDRRTAENENESHQGPHERENNVSTTTYAANMAQPLAELHVPGANNEARASDDRRTENEDENHQGPHEPPRENNARQKRTPYQQLAADMAQPLADLRVTGDNNETETRDEGQTENENESHQGPHEPPRESKAKQKRTPYQQLAADMAQPLADLHVPGANNEAGTTDDRRTAGNENESCQGPHERESNVSTTTYAANMAQPLADLYVPGADNEARASEDRRTENENEKSRQGPHEPPRESKAKQNRTPYQQLAADMAQPLADLHVPGASNKAGASDDRRTETDVGNRQASGHQREATARRPGRNHYFELAAVMSGPLSEIRVPGTGDDRSPHRDARMQTQRQATESFSQQQSQSEYEPGASCGSCCEQSSFQSEAHSEGEMGLVHDHRQQESWTCQDEGTESVVQQESLSEYNEDATCGSGFYRSDSEFSNYSNVQTAEFESTNQGSDGFPSKFPSEIDSTHKECHSQVDGEPFSKRTKPNPEVTEELSFPQPETSYMDSTTVGDTEFGSRQESIPVLFTVESKQNESFPIQSEEEISTRNSEGHTPLESCLSSELENMSLEDGYSVDTGASFDYSAAERSAPVSQSYQGIDNVNTGENASTASSYSQGARPKTREKMPRGKKSKTPKPNTKNAYTELAKEIAGDFSAMNSQLENANAKTHRAANERSSAREEELFDGGSIVQAMTPDATSLHAPPLEQEQRDTRQQPSLINNEGLRGRDASSQRDTGETAESRATSRQTRHDVAAERRSQVEEQQRLIDNMAPELQALVVQMMQREEEEQRGHVLHGTHLTPPVPPRLLSQRRGENDNQGACAEGALKQPEGKKSRKGSKTKGHYFELAGIMAPQLATVNAAMVNGHVEGQQGRTTGHDGRTEGNHSNGVTHGAVGESSHQERVSYHSTGARPRNHHLSNQGAGVPSRDHSRAHKSLPHSGTNQREATDGRGRRGNGNRKHGDSKDSTGKENRGQLGKQKKSKEEDTNKSSLLQMAESMAESLQDLNARLEEQQRQQRSLNGHGAAVRPLSPGNETGMELVPDESVTRDSSSDVTNKSTSSRKEHGHK